MSGPGGEIVEPGVDYVHLVIGQALVAPPGFDADPPDETVGMYPLGWE